MRQDIINVYMYNDAGMQYKKERTGTPENMMQAGSIDRCTQAGRQYKSIIYLLGQ